VTVPAVPEDQEPGDADAGGEDDDLELVEADEAEGDDAGPGAGDRRARRPGNRVRRFFLDLLDRLHRWAEAGWAPQATMAWGAMQGSVVPGPADALIVPLGVADPRIVYRLAIFATAGATIGGIIAWLIGANAFEELGRPILHLLGIGDATIARSEGLFDRRGWLIVLLATVTPVPSKLVCIAAGAFGVPFVPFALALGFGRGARFAVIALGVRLAGERIERWKRRWTRRSRRRSRAG
jgi:membrane protein YqaA with SNARE-associated domain